MNPNKKKSLKQRIEKSESIQLFKNPYLERLTHVHPVTPFILYIPVVLFSLIFAILSYQIATSKMLLFFFIGLFIWSITEYILHRFLFHIPQTNKLFKYIYFYTHKMHHDQPSDATRLVMPLGASLPIAIILFFSLKAITAIYFLPLYTGFVSGYLIYDFLHFATHFYRFKNSYFQKIRKNHMIHHYRASNKNFGITSSFWDTIFATCFDRNLLKKEDDNLNDSSGLPPL